MFLDKLFSKKENLKIEIPFDPTMQYPIIRSSICTGESVAGFKGIKDGHFTEVMMIRNDEDLKKFKEMYGLQDVKKEY